jgi:hypothetical protein
LQEVDLSSFGDIDAVKIKLAGTAATATSRWKCCRWRRGANWSQVKRFFR